MRLRGPQRHRRDIALTSRRLPANTQYVIVTSLDLALAMRPPNDRIEALYKPAASACSVRRGAHPVSPTLTPRGPVIQRYMVAEFFIMSTSVVFARLVFFDNRRHSLKYTSLQVRVQTLEELLVTASLNGCYSWHLRTLH